MNDTPRDHSGNMDKEMEMDTQQPARAVATFRINRWPGWIWGIPVAAVLIVVWLLLRALSASGTAITVVFNQASGMSPDDTHVMYRGLQVGTLKDLHLDATGEHVIASFMIKDNATRWLTSGTRFFLEGAKPSLSNLSSLKAIIAGPDVVMVPGKGKPARRYIGIAGEAPQLFEESVKYHLKFDEAVGGLDVGAPVKFLGFVVGDVTQVGLNINAKTGDIHTPVTIALDPTRFHLHSSPDAKGQWAPVLDKALQQLVSDGLRATLSQSPPIIGSKQVDLVMRTKAPTATLLAQSDGRPAIPTVATSGGPTQLIGKLDKLPLDAIARNVRIITGNVRQASQRVNELLQSPKLASSLSHLNDTLATLDHTMKNAAPQVVPTIKTLRAAANQIDDTAHSAQQLVGSAQKLVGGADASNGNVEQALQELSQTARAIRSLADYLQRHPNALIMGR